MLLQHNKFNYSKMERKQIIKLLNKNYPLFRNYDNLKSCLILNPDEKSSNEDKIDIWFEGIIKSLRYKVNHTILALVGDITGKTKFLRKLFPEIKDQPNAFYADTFTKEDLKAYMYTKLVINNEFTHKTLDIANNDNFNVLPFTPGKLIRFGDAVEVTDKRLASYCTTSSVWPYPQRKNVIVLHLLDINWGLYDSIDKLLLWIEIYNKFK